MGNRELKSKYDEIEKILSQGEYGNLVEKICCVLYGKRFTSKAGRSMEIEVRWRIKKRYKGVVVPYYKDWGKKETWLFDRLTEIESQYKKDEYDEKGELKDVKIEMSEEQWQKYDKGRQEREYYNAIENNLVKYYENITDIIMDSPGFLIEDLRYFLVYKFAELTGKRHIMDFNSIEELAGKYQFLRSIEITSTNRNTEEKIFSRGIKKLMKDNICMEKLGCNVIVEEKVKGVSIKGTNINFQFASIFYPKFGALFMNKKCNYDYQNIKNILENIVEIRESSYADKKMNLFMAEYLTGINLCMIYTKYYGIIFEKKEFNENIRRLLLEIFDEFMEMPNVFSRVQIVKEFMEPAIFFEQPIEKQLIYIQNCVFKLRDYMGTISDLVKKSKINSEDDNDDLERFLKQISNVYCFKNINQAKGKSAVVFVKENEQIREKSIVYRELQKRYIKKHDVSLKMGGCVELNGEIAPSP